MWYRIYAKDHGDQEDHLGIWGLELNDLSWKYSDDLSMFWAVHLSEN